MRDFATSDDPAVQAQLDRLARLSLPAGRLGLDTIKTMLTRLGNPQHRIPPAFHVSGTNGKGSTCAFLRAILEAQGLTVHTATKPHLVRYNERIRLAGELISDTLLAELLSEVIDACEDLGPSFFEVTTAATFLAFARVPADIAVIEVGLGGRFDATNVLEDPLACGIASLGMDHEAFLLRPEEGVPVQPMARIAYEKACIAHKRAPLVTQAYEPEATGEILRVAKLVGTQVAMRGQEWSALVGKEICYRDSAVELTLPLPTMIGTHQADNAALAVAMLRHQHTIPISADAMVDGIRNAYWPARLQKLSDGPLAALLPGVEIIVDGGHNPDAAQALAKALIGRPALTVIVGMLRNRNVAEFLTPLASQTDRLWAIPITGHEHHLPEEICKTAQDPLGIWPASPAPDVAEALRQIDEVLNREQDSRPQTVLVTGSLYLAGKVLAANDEIPD